MAGTITHKWNGTTLIVTSDSGTSSCDLKGEKGDMGIRGAQGADGKPWAGISLYPVGSIYMSVDGTSKGNPAELFGGTWERIKDRFLLAAGDNYKNTNTGGSADAVLIQHKHNVITEDSSNFLYMNKTTDGTKAGYYLPRTAESGNDYWHDSGLVEGSRYITGGATTQSVPDGSLTDTKKDKNMPPYLVVMVWKRIA